MTITPNPTPLLAFEGVLRAGVYAGLNTQELYSAIYNAMADQVGAVTPIALRDFNKYRSIAVQQRNAQRALSGAGNDAALSLGMVASNMVTRSEIEMATNPKYVLRYEHSFAEDGIEQTEWRSMTIRGALPANVADLRERAEIDADMVAEDYFVEHVGVGEMSLIAL